MRRTERDVAVCVVAVVAVVAAGFLVIRDYGELGSHSPDAVEYLRMAAGEGVPDPYANRVLGPAVAGALPGTPETGFRLLTAGSIAVALLAAAVLSLRVGASRGATVAAVALAAAAPALAYSFANPFLTDPPALAASSVSTAAFVLGSWPLFLVAVGVAVGIREGSAALALVWLPERQLRRFLASLAAAAVVLALARFVSDPNGRFVYVGMPSWSTWLIDMVRSWGPLWLAAVAGLFHVRVHRRRMLIVAGVLFLTGVALTFIFNDTERMLLPLLPVVVVGTAHLVDRAANRTARALLVLSVAVTPLLAFRNAVVPEASLLRESEALRIAVLLVGVGATGWMARTGSPEPAPAPQASPSA